MSKNLLSVLGLFIPVPIGRKMEGTRKWVFSFTVGTVPLGWIILATIFIVQLLHL